MNKVKCNFTNNSRHMASVAQSLEQALFTPDIVGPARLATERVCQCSAESRRFSLGLLFLPTGKVDTVG